MQSVRDWLATSGVTVADGWQLAAGGEVAVSADGNVIVGAGPNPKGVWEVWIARSSSGAITLDEVAQSLQDSARGAQMIVNSADLVLEGAHGRPLMRRVGSGQNTFWLTGDWGVDDHGQRDGELGIAELGVGRNLGAVQLNVSLGRTWTRQNLTNNGGATVDSNYLYGEALIPVAGKLWGVVSAYRHWGDGKLTRGYLNAGLPDASTGTPDVDGWALRGRLQWDGLWQAWGAPSRPMWT